jgi:hypothetical protein
MMLWQLKGKRPACFRRDKRSACHRQQRITGRFFHGPIRQFGGKTRERRYTSLEASIVRSLWG